MAHAQHRQSRERRCLADRRVRPTTLWSALRWQGRRQVCRRVGEGHYAYLDRLARRTVVLALFVFGASLLDALLTLLHLAHGGGEANPLLQTRVKTLNRELGSVCKQWYPDMEVEEMPDAA